MGRPVNNLRKAGITVKINKEGYKKLIQMADTVGLRMLAAIATFTVPSPTLVNLAASADALRAATAFMGLKRNRGSKAERLDAQAKATDLRSMLTAELKYVINIAETTAPSDPPLFATIINSSGFSMEDVRSITPKAQFATFVKQTNNKAHPGSEGRLKWRKPLGLIKGAKVAGYNIYIGGKIVQTTTKTNTLIPVVPGVNTDVMIVPFNSKGSGNAFFTTVKGMQ